MRALIRTLPIRCYTVTIIIDGNRRKRLLSRRGTSNLSVSGALRVSTTHDKQNPTSELVVEWTYVKIRHQLTTKRWS